MEFPRVTFVGPASDDPELLDLLPEDLRRFLGRVNGLIAFDGGLHVRGACKAPEWHSLRHIWKGERALHVRYAAVREADIPFAEDAMGDQWLLRATRVVRLSAETGDLDEGDIGWSGFWAGVERDPVEALGLHPLLQFMSEGGSLAPGQLLNAYPPFSTKEAAAGVRLAPVPALEQLDFLAELARQIPLEGEFGIRFVD